MGNECFQHSDYQYSEGLRLWTRPSSSSVSFSDGDDAEEYLLKLFSTAKDLSTNSRELRQAIRDWPSEYHLSPLRHNLLRPFRFPQRCKVLEVGCGCGAISRQFGELGLELTALEGSLRRAQITATRCQDLPNVKVVADSFNTFNFPNQSYCINSNFLIINKTS